MGIEVNLPTLFATGGIELSCLDNRSCTDTDAAALGSSCLHVRSVDDHAAGVDANIATRLGSAAINQRGISEDDSIRADLDFSALALAAARGQCCLSSQLNF